MMRSTTVLALLAAALPLAACGSSNEGGANSALPNPANSSATEMGNKVRDLPEGQRNGVLFRAIRDSGSTGQSCQAVTAMSEIEPVNGNPAWRAVCDNNAQWTIVFTADGTATVTGPSPLRKQG